MKPAAAYRATSIKPRCGTARRPTRPTPPRRLRLGILLSPGNGTRTDVVEAYKWLNLSASRWKSEALRVEAAARRDALEKQMTEPQVSEAIQRSLRWQDTVGMEQK
jgi:TPR repeat protein